MPDDVTMSDEPVDPDVEKVDTYEWPPGMKKQTVTCVLKMKPGIPVDPISFAKLITANVRLLEACDKNGSPDGKRRVSWTLIEAAVIGEQACFTLHGWSKSALDKATKEAKAKDVKVKGHHAPR